MILNCDNCETRYLLSTALLRPDGRRVRCSRCGHEWYQEPEEDPSFAEAMESAEPIPDSVRPDHESGKLSLLHEHTEAPAPRGSGILGYALAAGLLLAGLGVGYAFSGTVVKLWPSSLGIYRMAHLSPDLPGQSLVVDRVTAEVVTGERGLNVLHVKGYALNLKPEAQDMPPLRVSLLRKDGEPIDSWLIEAEKDTLGYEEEVSFTTTYPAPPTDAHAVNVRLEPFAVLDKAEDHAAAKPDAKHEDKHEANPVEKHGEESHGKPAAPDHAPPKEEHKPAHH